MLKYIIGNNDPEINKRHNYVMQSWSTGFRHTSIPAEPITNKDTFTCSRFWHKELSNKNIFSSQHVLFLSPKQRVSTNPHLFCE